MRGTGFARPAHALVSALAPTLASAHCAFRDEAADPLARVARRSGRSSCCRHAERPHASPRDIVRWEFARSRSGRSSGSSAPSRSVDCDCRSRTARLAALRRSSARFPWRHRSTQASSRTRSRLRFASPLGDFRPETSAHRGHSALFATLPEPLPQTPPRAMQKLSHDHPSNAKTRVRL
jgi:hypothetical protein